MRVLVIVVLLVVALVSVAFAGTSDQSRRAAEEDICYAFTEYNASNRIFMDETNGSYMSGSPGARLAQDVQNKLTRTIRLQDRYFAQYGKKFNAFLPPFPCNGR